MKFVVFAMLLMPSLGIYAQSDSLSGFSDHLPRALESESITVLARDMANDLAVQQCNKNGGKASREVARQADAWDARNQAFTQGANRAISEIGDSYLPYTGPEGRKKYLQMVVQETVDTASQGVMAQLDVRPGVARDAPLERACAEFAARLGNGSFDFRKAAAQIPLLAEYIGEGGRTPHRH